MSCPKIPTTSSPAASSGTTHGLTGSAVTFAAPYLLVHGIVKIGLVTALLRHQAWAYPRMIGFLVIFIGYQFYRLALDPTFWLTALTVFDALTVWLTWRERRRHRTVPSASGTKHHLRSAPTETPRAAPRPGTTPRATHLPANWQVGLLQAAGAGGMLRGWQKARGAAGADGATPPTRPRSLPAQLGSCRVIRVCRRSDGAAPTAGAHFCRGARALTLVTRRQSAHLKAHMPRACRRSPRWDQAARNVGVLVGVVAGAHSVVAVGDVKRRTRKQVTSHQQDG